MFSQIERAWRGIILDSPQTALRAAERTKTQAGLRVTVNILEKVYEVGRACSKAFRSVKDNFVRHDEFLGQWNYVIDGKGLS
jgi:hypothetical protein